MCYAFDAAPPDLPLAGGASSATPLTLTSADGTAFSAYLARPNVPNGAGIVVMPDVRGLFGFYQELADWFAAAGITAIAIDYFGRTAGLGTRDADFEFMPHVRQTQTETVAADVAAAVARLREQPGVVSRAIFTVGFCFGGLHSFLQAASGHGLAGVIGFYGPPAGSRLGGTAPLDLVSQFACPVLGLFGGNDPGIPNETVERFDAALGEAKIAHEIVSYPGAPHSFFDRSYAQYSEESADAWRRILGFIERYARRPVSA